MTIDLTDVRALTLRNPWSHLVARHGKTVENRGWMPPETVYRLLIHAGKTWTPDGRALLDRYDTDGCVDTSAIVAVADLAFACNTSRSTATLTCGCNREWAQPGQCHWNLLNVRALPEAVPAVGRQGLWRPAPDVVDAVERQLAVAS